MSANRQRPPKAAALYVRISQDRAGEGLGVQRQEELCRDLAERLGWTVAEVYTDNDLSAYTGKRRPAYERMLADVEAGARDGVLVVDQDRLTRHPAELEDFIVLADRLGVALANVSGDIDLGTSDGRFKARIMGAVARQESEKKSERLRRQRAQAARLGKRHGGRRPYGYEPDGVTVRDAEADRVREAAARVLAGDSLRTVARDFNARGVAAAGGGIWRVGTLASMLAGPRVAGLRAHHGQVVGDAEWPAILDRATWERLRTVLGDPRRRTTGRPPSNLLTGLLRCGRDGCGASLSSSGSRRSYRRYVCHPPPSSDGCGRLGVHAQRVEDEVRDQVLAVLASPKLTELLAAGADAPDGLAEQLADDEAKLKALARDFAEDRLTAPEWLEARGALEDRIRGAKGALTRGAGRRVLADLPSTPEALRAEWDRRGLDWRRALLAAVVEYVVVLPHDRSKPTKKFDPDRVKPKWRA